MSNDTFQVFSETPTVRQLIAAMALQGILANPTYEPPRRGKLKLMARDAVDAADALIVELERTK